LETIAFSEEDCMLALLPKLEAQTQLKRIGLHCFCSDKNLEIIIAALPKSFNYLYYSELGDDNDFEKFLVLLLNCSVQRVEVVFFRAKKTHKETFMRYLDAEK
jgi:hypothetical protein